MDKVVDTPWFTTELYSVEVCEIKGEDGDPLTVYGVINIDTGVREAELRALPHAIQWARKLTESLDKALAEVDSENALRDALEGLPEGNEEIPVESYDTDPELDPALSQELLDGV